MYELKILLQTVLLPPVNCLVLALIGVWLSPRRVGRILIWAAGLVFLVSSLPVVGLTLMDAGSRRMAISDDAVAASQAIVLLPGGLYTNAAEYGGRDVASNNTLVRGRYVAWLHRRHGLPILVVGERAAPSARTEAATAAGGLESVNLANAAGSSSRLERSGKEGTSRRSKDGNSSSGT